MEELLTEAAVVVAVVVVTVEMAMAVMEIALQQHIANKLTEYNQRGTAFITLT
jgi:hypothetical protein